MISIWDHLLVVAFAVFLPAYARYRYPLFKRDVESGLPDVRAEQYKKTALRQWVFALAALLIWFHRGRSREALGLGTPTGWRFWLGVAIALLLAALWRRLFQSALRDDEGRKRLLQQLRALEPLLPTTPRELRLFTMLSLTAGFCEELLFRGYLIWYLQTYVGFGAACVLSAVIFGLGHLYQGPPQAVKIIFLGCVFVLFYVGTGSLWVPMGLHAMLDAAQGRLAYGLLKESRRDLM